MTDPLLAFLDNLMRASAAAHEMQARSLAESTLRISNYLRARQEACSCSVEEIEEYAKDRDEYIEEMSLGGRTYRP